jgi:ADP-ribose pyrophosphatase YjhB (NUDIX family)
MKNYYIGKVDEPYHISVGAILRNHEGNIACHHFDEIAGMKDIYILMRETIEPGESMEDALHRGLMEEFGAKATIETYMGSIVATLDTSSQIQKTTLYFLCTLDEINEQWRKSDDEERDSHIEWHSPEFLIKKMQRQMQTYRQEDLDESAVLERLAHLPIKSEV